MTGARAPRRPRRSRWWIVVGGEPNTAGYVEIADALQPPRVGGPRIFTHGLDTRDGVIAHAQTFVRAGGGKSPVCVYQVPRVGARRVPAPVWFFEPSGLPEAWGGAARAAATDPHEPPAPTVATRGGEGRTRRSPCPTCGQPAPGGARVRP